LEFANGTTAFHLPVLHWISFHGNLSTVSTNRKIDIGKSKPGNSVARGEILFTALSKRPGKPLEF
jgi:hypothetical protein